MSSVVSFVLRPVVFAPPRHDTDAQNLAWLLLGVVTRPPNGSHGVQGVAGSIPGSFVARAKFRCTSLTLRFATSAVCASFASTSNRARMFSFDGTTSGRPLYSLPFDTRLVPAPAAARRSG